MKNLLACLTLLFLFSCAKENLAPAEETPNDLEIAKEYLSKYQSVLLFANLELNHETNRVSGFVIDKRGDLFAFADKPNPGIDPSIGFISDQLMRDILSYGDKASKVSLPVVEVADNVKRAFKLSKTNNLTADAPETATTSLLLHFQRNVTHAAPETCGPGQYDQGPSHHQNFVSLRGRYHFDNNFNVGPELVEWLGNLGSESN